jgi:hypothetical protein
MAMPRFAIQVSDRRLTAGTKIESETANKQVLCGKSMCFGYTGLAELEGTPTDAWLRDVLDEPSSDSLYDIVEHLRHRATQAIARSHVRPEIYRRMAFLGTGWTARPSDGAVCPAMVRISNFHDKYGSVASIPAKEFSYQGFRYFPSTGDYQALAALPLKQQIWLKRRMARFDRSDNGPRAWTMVKIFIEVIRQLADEPSINGAVGKDLLATIIPRAALDSEHLAISSGDGTGMVCALSGGVQRTPEEFMSTMESMRNASVICMEFPVGHSKGLSTTPLIARSNIRSAKFYTDARQTLFPQSSLAHDRSQR